MYTEKRFSGEEMPEVDGERIADIRIGEYLIDDIMKCVGKKADVYVKKFERLHEKGYSFNWCAALFTAIWFAYRRMWKAAAAVMGFNVVYSVTFSILQEKMMTSANAITLMWVAIGLFIVSLAVFGLLGDWLYCRHVSGILDSQGCRGRSAVENSAVNESLRRAGGTSIKGLIILWIVSLVLEWGLTWIIS